MRAARLPPVSIGRPSSTVDVRETAQLSALDMPVTLDIDDRLGHRLSHEAACLGSLRLLQGIYEGRRATLH